VAIQSVLIGCVCKTVLDCQPTTINLILLGQFERLIQKIQLKLNSFFLGIKVTVTVQG